ncbi:ribonuclease P protein subunit p38 [Esox lucius]|nr:ribonuclease P protein subunit p38 [Esox lucius]XP_010883062.1 ribonuclease P protein subunit p38 [Esox lucius]XP_010883063.1 ribonuclease P protein subunit p38 [Esox lucius]XP_010883064.1 ribonuclease P protein subunit p38 [Esox lucius]XP_010883065.1 ribonuclease P protein subunit p38 [Esox lucius]
MATQGKLSKKERKKQIPAKTSLNSPYSLQWSPLQRGDMHFILETLKSKLSATGLEKKEIKRFRQWGKRANKKQPTGLASVAEPPLTPLNTKPELSVKSSEQGWTNLDARRQLAIGINEVTKAVERNQLRLVLVCKSVKPPHMTNHLIALCQTRGVAACQVPRLSENVAGLLGLRCVLALGFRRGNEEAIFFDAVEAIVPRVPALQVAWMLRPASETIDTDEGKVAEEKETHDRGQVGEERAEVQMEVDTGEELRGQKRKMEGFSPNVTESPSCILQPLKVKKIIPNPNKKRKPKAKKK